MARIAVLGESRRIQALSLAGAETHEAATAQEVVAQWTALSPDVAVLILTASAAETLTDLLRTRRDLLVTVLP